MHQFLILGGDPRQLYLTRRLKKAGQKTLLYYDNSTPAFSLRDAMETSDIILCPVPFSKDGHTIFSDNHLEGLEIDTFLNHLTKGHTLFGGNIPPSVKAHCESRRIPCHDFMQMETVACKNSAATAEGALAEAISLSPINLYKSRCLVLGWGRCARTLADRLKGLGTAVTVAARDDRQLAHADCLGYDTVLLEDLTGDIDRFDFIFNTIPAMVLDSVLLEAAKPEAAIVDIASAPGGVDFETCRHLGIPAKLCPGLPGVYAPMSSAEILYEAVMDHL
ncbi:dipicolinate synthase subunit DpsA [Hungatella hathewayi]|uniref:dipicolinate synthase subunit DpsA n=1 Tax=Hungatella hathewayi TaxID=154046 RepID=UPI0011DDC454|nr:dipicolinate synthase subunit DpsA [Hungatella hathewayi]